MMMSRALRQQRRADLLAATRRGERAAAIFPRWQATRAARRSLCAVLAQLAGPTKIAILPPRRRRPATAGAGA